VPANDPENGCRAIVTVAPAAITAAAPSATAVAGSEGRSRRATITMPLSRKNSTSGYSGHGYRTSRNPSTSSTVP
jgi:hypothetical protein